MKNLIKCVLTLSLLFSLTSGNVYAQAQGAGGGESSSELRGTRKQLATIIFAGLAGAVLGLSTLSFHGRPQDHLSNIAVGFAVGTIAGTIYTTYQAASAPRNFYDYGANSDFNKMLSADFVDQSPQFEMKLAAYSWSF